MSFNFVALSVDTYRWPQGYLHRCPQLVNELDEASEWSTYITCSGWYLVNRILSVSASDEGKLPIECVSQSISFLTSGINTKYAGEEVLRYVLRIISVDLLPEKPPNHLALTVHIHGGIHRRNPPSHYPTKLLSHMSMCLKPVLRKVSAKNNGSSQEPHTNGDRIWQLLIVPLRVPILPHFHARTFQYPPSCVPSSLGMKNTGA